MSKCEKIGDYANPEYATALETFYKTYFCRLENWPKELSDSLAHSNPTVSNIMNGPNEFTIIGNIRHWKVSQAELCRR